MTPIESSTTWDAIVIGSGPGGLTTAAYLAAAGQRVVVLEQHDIAGGNCQTFRRKEYEFDVGLHYIGDCRPGGTIPSVLKGLGLEDRVEFREMDPDGFDTLVYPDLELRVPAGWDAYLERLIETFPDDQQALESVIGVFRSLGEEIPSSFIPGMEKPVTDAWGGRLVADLFAEFGLSSRAACVLGHWGGLYGSGPADSGCWMHALIINHYMAGAFYPAGGGQVIPARLVQVIEASGGEVRTLARVDEILVNEGIVQGVRLHDGTVLHAPVVVSNADYKRTVLELTNERHWSASALEWARDSVMTLGLVIAYVVLDTDIAKDLPNCNYFIFPDWDLEDQYEGLEGGRVPSNGVWAYISMASRKDPDNPHLCPPGHTNFQIMTLAPRGYSVWGLDEGPTHGARYRRNEEYRSKKEWFTDQLIDAAEGVLGPFRDHIVHLETATPLSQERYTLSSDGTSYGLQFSPEQTGDRRPGHRTEIQGLYLVGASTSFGNGIGGTMIGGLNCAGQILDRELVAEVMMGGVIADPSLVPEDPPGWDPFDVSRGRALTELRAERTQARADAERDRVSRPLNQGVST